MCNDNRKYSVELLWMQFLQTLAMQITFLPRKLVATQLLDDVIKQFSEEFIIDPVNCINSSERAICPLSLFTPSVIKRP
jgi:hypothetical protein